MARITISKWIRKRPVLVGVALLAVAGAVLISLSLAATTSVQLEAESATRSGAASVTTDATASGGSALLFGTAPGGGGGGSAATYPLKVSSNNRYLTDQAGTPYLLVGDTAWNLFTRVNNTEVAQYLDARKAQGFNTILASVIDITAGGINGANRDGNPPFTANNIGSPNPAYFSHVDEVLNLAKERNMQVVIVAAWHQMVAKNTNFTAADADTYGKFLGQRYAAYDNIIWMMGGDWGGPTEGTCPNQDQVRAMANGIRTADTRHPITYHPGYGISASMCHNDQSWLTVNANYWDFNFGNVSAAYKFMYRDYDNNPVRPVFMAETGFEGYHSTLTARASRMQSYYQVLGGGLGFTYGAAQTYDMANGQSGATRTWQETLTIPGGDQQGYAGKFFGGMDWWKLVPDRGHQFVTSGLGNEGDESYVTASFATDGSVGAAYIPGARTVGINLAKFSSQVTAQWYDPTNGQYRPVDGSPFANTGSRDIATPGNNAAGNDDWALVLKTN